MRAFAETEISANGIFLLIGRSRELNWHVYIILCSDDSLYTGITTDVERRLRQHAAGRGAKYFRGRQPKELIYLESGHDRSTASKRERSIKMMKRADKAHLIASASNTAAIGSIRKVHVVAPFVPPPLAGGG